MAISRQALPYLTFIIDIPFDVVYKRNMWSRRTISWQNDACDSLGESRPTPVAIYTSIRYVTDREQAISGPTRCSQMYFNEYVHTTSHQQGSRSTSGGTFSRVGACQLQGNEYWNCWPADGFILCRYHM
jgi:hypothetical protein